jgi:hypothetical protein
VASNHTEKNFTEVVWDMDPDLVMERLVFHHAESLALEVLSIGRLVVVPMLDDIKFNCRSISFPNE